MQLLDPRPVDLIDEPLKPDDVIVCGGCGLPSILTLFGTRLPNEEEFSSFPPKTQSDLAFALRAIQIKLRND